MGHTSHFLTRASSVREPHASTPVTAGHTFVPPSLPRHDSIEGGGAESIHTQRATGHTHTHAYTIYLQAFCSTRRHLLTLPPFHTHHTHARAAAHTCSVVGTQSPQHSKQTTSKPSSSETPCCCPSKQPSAPSHFRGAPHCFSTGAPHSFTAGAEQQPHHLQQSPVICTHDLLPYAHT
jgi:hypothetical protein